MSQGPLCPNLTQKVQKEVSQIANRNLSPVILLGGLSVNLNHLKSHLAEYIFTPLCQFLTQNSKYPLLQRCLNFFDTWTIGTQRPTKQPSSDMVKNPK